MSKETMEKYLEDYLDNICKDNKDVVEADKNLNTYTSKITSADDAWEADWWATQVAYQHEKQGFFGGFLYAMSLLRGQGVLCYE